MVTSHLCSLQASDHLTCPAFFDGSKLIHFLFVTAILEIIHSILHLTLGIAAFHPPFSSPVLTKEYHRLFHVADAS